MAKDDEGELTEMRCRSCGTLLGYRRRQGPFIFWCSEACAETIMAKSERDQIRDEVAVELYLAGVGIMEVSRFTETPYTRIQQLLYRRGISLSREKASA
jgi:hypothetical protein